MKNQDWVAECSKCKNQFLASEAQKTYLSEYQGGSSQGFSYCPNCGADSCWWEDLGNGNIPYSLSKTF